MSDGEGHESVERIAFERSKREAIIDGGVNIVKDVEGGIPVSF